MLKYDLSYVLVKLFYLKAVILCQYGQTICSKNTVYNAGSFLLFKASLLANFKNVFPSLSLGVIFQKRTLTLLTLLGSKEPLLDNA